MKSVINLKHWQALLFSIVLLSSFVISKSYTDPFFVPKTFFYFISASFFLLFILLYHFRKKFDVSIGFSITDLAIITYVAFSFAMLVFTENVSVDNDKFYILLLTCLLYFFIKPFLFDYNKKLIANQVVTIVNVLLLIAIVQCVWGALQYFDVSPNWQKEFKIGGAFGNPGQYTNFLTPILSFAFSVALFSKQHKLLGIITTICILLVLPFTEARAAWIGAFVILAYLIEVRYGYAAKMFTLLKYKVLRIGVVMLLLLFVVLGGYYLYNYKKNSSSGRLFIWQVSVNMVKDKPMAGHGYDSFAAAHNNYQAAYFAANPTDKKNAEIADGVNFAFNEFLQAAIELGVVGSILLLLLFALPLITLPNKLLTKPENYFYYAAKGSLLSILISCLVSYPLHSIPSLVLLFLSIAIIDAQRNEKVFNLVLNPSKRKVILTVGLVLVVTFLYVQIKRNNYERDWPNAFNLMRQENFDEAYVQYKKLYPVLSYNKYFLFNYGAELMLMKRYDESIALLKEAEPRLNDSDFYIYLGSSYESIGKLEEAEKCFEKASNIMPLKFFPKYRLVGVYLKTGRKIQAVDMAKLILEMKIKVPSATIDAIRAEMQNLVSNNVTL